MQYFARYTCASFAATLAALLSAPAEALPLFTAQASLNGGVVQYNTGNISAGAQAFFSPIASATALASSSGLLATGQGRANNGAVSGTGVATATFDDFVISGAPGPVTTSFNMALSGDLGVLTLTPSGERLTQASAAVIVQVVVNDQIVTGDAFFQDRYRLFSQNDVLETQATGMLASWSPQSGVITTPSFNVEAGVPLPLASRAARDGRYDVHALIDLVERGCPAELAVRILAPLEELDAA